VVHAEHGSGHDDHGHHGPLHHHFTDMAQQRESNALGMWVFLVTEVMTFGALFFAYTLYRHLFDVASYESNIRFAANPAGFLWASPFATGSHLLNNYLGFGNTLVLLVSSLTMASAVHHAAMRNKKLLITMLSITWLLGLTFLGVKAVEWTTDYKEGLVPGLNWNPGHTLAEKGFILTAQDGVNGGAYSPITTSGEAKAELERIRAHYEAEEAAEGAPAAAAPAHDMQHKPLVNGMQMQMFFVIYFCMTGLHAIHMIIGLGLVGTFIWHAKNGIFTVPGNEQPVEILGLYWHFVDIVWVFLYPLLYLIAH
jgi:cytochrome c oxidase subunit 3